MALYDDLDIQYLPDNESGKHRFEVNYALTDRAYWDIRDKHIASNDLVLQEFPPVVQRLVKKLHGLPQVKTVAVIPTPRHCVEITIYRDFGWEEDDVAHLVIDTIEQHFEWCRKNDIRLRSLDRNPVRQVPQPTRRSRRSGRKR